VDQHPENLLDFIPPSAAVRERLAEALQAAQLLRDLLKAAERKERYGTEPRQQQGGRRAS
jgi:hypothetical protein